MFENLPERFKNENKTKNNSEIKEGVDKFLKGKINEADFKGILKENNIDPDSNLVIKIFLFWKIQKHIRSASITGLNEKRSLLYNVLNAKKE